MTSTEPQFRPTEDVRCTYHPSVMTRLRCSRCGKPICPRCGVRTPVGLRCPECAGVRGLPTYPTDSTALAKSALYGGVLAVAIGVLWGFIPTWNFYLALAMGFAVSEVVARAAKGKRGRDLQVVAIVAVLIGVTVSRVVLANRLGLTLDDVNQLDKFTQQQLYLNVIPDGLFVALSAAIAWYRFR